MIEDLAWLVTQVKVCVICQIYYGRPLFLWLSKKCLMVDFQAISLKLIGAINLNFARIPFFSILTYNSHRHLIGALTLEHPHPLTDAFDPTMKTVWPVIDGKLIVLPVERELTMFNPICISSYGRAMVGVPLRSEGRNIFIWGVITQNNISTLAFVINHNFMDSCPEKADCNLFN
jgi:hypothetical protein